MEHTPYPESGADGRCLGDAVMQEDSDDDDLDLFRDDPIKYSLSFWVAELDDATGDAPQIPLSIIVHYRDLLEKGWGWQRLVPYNHGNVDWTVFKGYLEEYYIQNAGEVAALCADKKPEEDKYYFCYMATKNDTIKDKCTYTRKTYTRKVSDFILASAAEMCIEMENNFRHIYCHRLTAEDITLSCQIEERANNVLQSAGVCYNAAAALVCIVKETVLLSELLDWRSDTTEMVKLCKKIRQSAYKLMLYEGPESAAAAGALVGLAKEAKFLLYVLSREDRFAELDYYSCHTIRSQTTTALDVLLQECDTSSGGHVSCALAVVKSDKPQGTVGYLNYVDVNATSAGAKSLMSQGTFGDLNCASDDCDLAGDAVAESEKPHSTVVGLNCKILASMEQSKVDLSDCCEIDCNAKCGLTINKDDELEGEHLDPSDLWKCSTGRSFKRRMTL